MESDTRRYRWRSLLSGCADGTAAVPKLIAGAGHDIVLQVTVLLAHFVHDTARSRAEAGTMRLA